MYTRIMENDMINNEVSLDTKSDTRSTPLILWTESDFQPESCTSYYELNKDTRKAYQKEYYQKNRDKYNQPKNPEQKQKFKEYMREYRKKKKEIVNIEIMN